MISYSGYGSWFTLRLLDEGHEVDYYLLEKKYSKILQGIAPDPIYHKPDFSKYDLILFDLTGHPKLAEEAITIAPTLGDSDLADILENDRVFGIEVMEKYGIEVPPYEVFHDTESAKKFVSETKKRYVFKPSGGQRQETASTYVSESSEDLIRYLDQLEKLSHGAEFILQEVVEGIEISTEAWFNGEEFFLVNGTLEEKKFMNDRIGPNTGCAGNLVWTYGQEPRIFERGLGLLKPFLQESGYRGMIDLNTIASRNHLYGLEWTPRFGYDAAATLFSTISSDLGEFLLAIASGNSSNVELGSSYAASTRLSIPPYPSECPGYYREDIPIGGIEPKDIEGIYLYDAKLNDDELVTAGCSGFICAPIGTGRSIEESWSAVKEKNNKIKIPDKQFRTDLYRHTKERYEALSKLGWLR